MVCSDDGTDVSRLAGFTNDNDDVGYMNILTHLAQLMLKNRWFKLFLLVLFFVMLIKITLLKIDRTLLVFQK